MPTAESLAARTTAPGASAAGKAIPALPPAPPGSRAGVCNAYLPNGPTTFTRFLWVVKYFVERGMYVLVDYHTHDHEAALETPQALADAWLRLWKGLTQLPGWPDTMQGRVFVDVL
jgi:hypothetical protein